MRTRCVLAAAVALLLCGRSSLAARPAQDAGPEERSAPLSVRRAVRLALESHPSVGASRAALREAESAIGSARAAWFPTLAVDGSVTRFQEPMIVAPLHGFDFRQPPDFNRTLVRGELGLGFTLFDGGARTSRIREARATRDAWDARVGSSEMDLIARVVEGYADVLTARDVLDAQDRRLQALSAERERARRLLAEGRAAEVELLRAEAAVAAATAERVAAAAELGTASRTLARLAGLDERAVEPEALVDFRLGTTPEVALPGPALDRVVESNPETRAARERVRAAEENRRVARAAWLPELDLVAGLLSLGSVDGEFTTEWRTGISVSYPLFTGGGRASAVSRATARREVAEQNLRATQLAVRDEADRAAALIRSTAARAEALDAAVDHLEEVVRIERLALDTGAGLQTDYLRAQADLLEARTGRSRARRTHVTARAELARLEGELTPAWVVRNLEEGR